ncbi:exported hypothetical protein [Paraburkholderia caribensis]|nr:exported hypothetical protein [Paraburkholderia caribensis]
MVAVVAAVVAAVAVTAVAVTAAAAVAAVVAAPAVMAAASVVALAVDSAAVDSVAAVSAKVAATAVAQVQAAVTAAATDTEVERTAPPCRPIRRQPRNARRRFLAGVGGDVSIPRSNVTAGAGNAVVGIGGKPSATRDDASMNSQQKRQERSGQSGKTYRNQTALLASYLFNVSI